MGVSHCDLRRKAIRHRTEWQLILQVRTRRIINLMRLAGTYLRYWRGPWALTIFLIGYLILLVVISHYYLLPAADSWRNATPTERRLLSASSALLLSVVLLIVIVGLLLVLRVRRYFQFPSGARTKTEYVDAWSESARRMKVPDDSNDPQQ